MELPNSWISLKLNELTIFAIGGDWGKDPNFDDENFTTVLCIRGSEFRNWIINKGSTASSRKIKISSLENRKLIDGDILVEISGGGPEQPVGRTVLIDKSVLSFSEKTPKVCTNFLRLLRTVKDVDSKFLNA
jgi:type I restriction enzyme S subunit